MEKSLEVVAAFIKKGNKFLLCQRKDSDRYGGLWEFPGGCVEKGETHSEAIEREIYEELGVNIKAKKAISNFFDEDAALKIEVFFYECFILSGEIFTKDCQNFGFFNLEEIQILKLAPVDKKIIFYLKQTKL